MEYDVTIDRDKWIGGSDIPIIMGISTFKSRWDLLQEKAGLKENTFTGNKYTEFGNTLEPKIRDFINWMMDTEFEPFKVTQGNFRGHLDGFNGKAVLEIKTTSHIHDSVEGYKVYLVQLLKYMEVAGVQAGVLAVYERPQDFSTEFDDKRLKLYPVRIADHTDLLNEINEAIDSFLSDLKKLNTNPLLCEQDFQPNELVVLSQKVVMFENRLAEMKQIESELKKAKQALFDEMVKHDVKSWETPNGTKITRVDSTPGKTEIVAEFDAESFKEENPALYEMYLHDVEKKTNGKSGYVKITLPKE